jgi:thiol-disulfide isomerase/thioredoxin
MFRQCYFREVIELPTLKDIQEDTESCTDSIESLSPAYRGGFLRQKQEYSANQEALDRLKELCTDYSIVVMYADWCGDARRAVPVLALIEEYTGKKIPSLRGMTKPSYGSDKLWAVPPSPPEVDTFGVTSSPTILIFNKEGKEIGRIKTRQKMTPTIEEEIVRIIEDSLKSS